MTWLKCEASCLCFLLMVVLRNQITTRFSALEDLIEEEEEEGAEAVVCEVLVMSISAMRPLRRLTGVGVKLIFVSDAETSQMMKKSKPAQVVDMGTNKTPLANWDSSD